MFQRNRIELTGHITKPAKTAEFGDSTLTRARLIHNETIPRKDADSIEQLTAIDIEIWGRRGVAFEEHVTTKTPIYIEGQLRLDEWEKDGQRFFKLFVRVNDWQFLAPKPETADQPAEADAA